MPSLSARVFDVVATSAVIALAAATSARTETLTCDRVALTVTARTKAQAAEVCRIGEAALEELASCNVDVGKPQTIELVDALANDCVGVYHCGQQRIELLSPEALDRARTSGSAFAQIPTDRYFASVLLHELAHAAYDEVACPFGTCIATSEYVAYAMQVRSFSPEDRMAFEARYDASNEVTRDALTAMTLFMAPDRFARHAWSHFSQRQDGCGFVGQIMQGDVLLDFEHP